MLINSHRADLVEANVKCQSKTVCLCCILQSYFSWIKSIVSLELRAICSTSSESSGENQAPAPLPPTHSNYHKHRWQLYTGGKWMLMECCHYLQVWDAAQVLSANSDIVCLVHNWCVMFYMPLLIFTRPTVTSQFKENGNLWLHCFIKNEPEVRLLSHSMASAPDICVHTDERT